MSIRIVLESVLRNVDGKKISENDVRTAPTRKRLLSPAGGEQEQVTVPGPKDTRNTSEVTEYEMVNNRPSPDRVDAVAFAEQTPTHVADLHHGDVLIAAITSCTNTSNPSVMLAADWWRQVRSRPVPQQAGFSHRRLRLHDLHRELRPARPARGRRDHAARPDRGVGAQRQPHHAGPCYAADRPPICATWSTLFSVEHSLQTVKHRALSRRFLRRFSRSRIATLRVSLRVTTFYATH